ncbi:MAG: ArsC family transcriptional regulator [Clostridia bacterium]|jgi:arsenate reductase-like glutaredoxin family protein|nr:ArsC family transcriptional regulator [Clostridia bacterium]MBQ1967134.1 ArsC family transcriptional regulator [Clostridia bacterium]MBQ1995543.1 ArsC family transcriptional regulator [Clostridia bacterium]MBQ5905845.1 ArsC family transcriptional regulator [Clostridia bacterium]
MNIQIYGTAKCFDTKKAQRYFKERNIKFQFVDLSRFGMSKGEYQNIKKALGMKLEDLVNEKSKKYESSFIKYLASEEAKEEKLLENQELFKTPIVRNGKKATLGYCPDEWKKWEEEK